MHFCAEITDGTIDFHMRNRYVTAKMPKFCRKREKIFFCRNTVQWNAVQRRMVGYQQGESLLNAGRPSNIRQKRWRTLVNIRQ